MPKTSSNKEQDEFQCVNIDLPGEAIQCTRSKSKIKVILRKHRDVVLDIKLLKELNYTIESEASPFYSVRDKKLITAGKKVTLKNEERLHLWVARDFKGHLVLKASNSIIGKYNIEKLDPIKYGYLPKEKPAPFIISLKNDVSQEENKSSSSDDFLPKKTAPFSSSINPNSEAENFKASFIEEKHPIVQVVQVAEDGIPEKILKHIQTGGGKSGLADLDINEVATRNWLYGQLAGTTAYVADNWEWLRNSIDTKTAKGTKFVTAKFHKINGKIRVYFSGYSNSNPIFRQGGHGSSNAKIIQIFSGAGSAKSSFSAAWKAVLGTIKNNTLISFAFSTATSYLEWKSDTKKDGYDFASNLIISILKTLLVAIISSIITAIVIVFVAIIFTGAIPVIAVGIFGITASMFITYGIDYMDKSAGKSLKGDSNGDGISGYVAPKLRKAGEIISENWDYLKLKSEKEYEEIVLWAK
ncbi:hypothetical protein R6242_21735 [Iodobacter sp. CM08]|uniref:hypothetical protein n=1 Tax=Iodobacter sp. CM08 TaxID=3085902 RepID=UPI0029811A86|nr:hypothetical protein [Iodobacter sp. CM08]MDW5419199.1 hypothetical protein [Iodobacter sp. CM08]